MSDLLNKLGDHRPDKGTVPNRRHRVDTLLTRHQSELLCIDEVQHLGAQMQGGVQKYRDEASTVQNNLKKFLLDGMPIVFLGRPEARHKIFGDEQIDLRLEEEINFSPLDYHNAGDLTIMRDFCGRLAGMMFQEGIFDHIVDLVTGDLPALICEAVDGRLGLVTVLVRWATRIALQEGMGELERRHLSQAVDQYLLHKVITCRVNPFNVREYA